MVRNICGRCGTAAHMSYIGSSTKENITGEGPPEFGELFGVFRCDWCQAYLTAEVVVRLDDVPRGGEPSWFGANPDKLRWTPRHVEGKDFPDVPRHIADAASEVHRSYGVQAYRAVGSVARAVIEAVAKDKGIKDGAIGQKIDQLAAGNHIRPHTQEAAHEIRHFDNDMAHGDFVDEVDADDARSILSFMDMVLQEVYQSPAEIERMKQRRLAKKSGTPAVA